MLHTMRVVSEDGVFDDVFNGVSINVDGSFEPTLCLHTT